MSDPTSSFNIESKSIKKIIKTNSDNILSICILNDGRIATSTFCEIVIYNLETDKKDMEIHENIEEVSHLFLMRSGYLFSSACEECIIYDIKENSYDIIQKLGELDGDTSKSIELDNGDIICLHKGFYVFKFNPAQSNYFKYKYVEEDNFFNDIIQINAEKIVTSNNADQQLKFWNIKDWSLITQMNNIQVGPYNNCLYLIDSRNMIIGGTDSIYLIDLTTYNIKKKINNKYTIFSICPISDKTFLTTGNEGTITQWKFDNDEINKEHEKENLAKEECLCMAYLTNGQILLGDSKNLIIIE
jgi:hypothetical protein